MTRRQDFEICDDFFLKRSEKKVTAQLSNSLGGGMPREEDLVLNTKAKKGSSDDHFLLFGQIIKDQEVSTAVLAVDFHIAQHLFLLFHMLLIHKYCIFE